MMRAVGIPGESFDKRNPKKDLQKGNLELATMFFIYPADG